MLNVRFTLFDQAGNHRIVACKTILEQRVTKQILVPEELHKSVDLTFLTFALPSDVCMLTFNTW